MLIIDSDDYKKAGIETLFFSGGEPHCKIPEMTGTVVLFLKLRTWNDVGLAACVVDAVARSNAERVITFIPYFPGARQDKPNDAHSPFTVRLMGKLFEHGGQELVTFDIHSKAALYGSDANRNLMPAHLPVPIKPDVVGVIAPDKGAAQRATEFRDRFYPGVPVIECSKKRNQETGELSDYHMPPLPNTGRYIIVDDICDGGRTFNLLAEEFVKDPLNYGWDNKLELFVSHGIFSRGISNLHPKIEHITTTDSWCKGLPDVDTIDGRSAGRLTIIPLLSALLGEEE